MTREKSSAVTIDSLDDFFVGDTERHAVSESYLEELHATPKREGDLVELLAFWVGNEEYALDISAIQEIIKVPSITAVPRMKTAVLGIISLRGTIVPVVDLRTLLSVVDARVDSTSRILVLRGHGDGEPLGVVVDRVSSVQRFGRDEIEPVPRTMQRDTSEFLKGVARIEDQLLIELDFQALFAFMEREP